MQQPANQGDTGSRHDLTPSELFLLLKAAIRIESNLVTDFSDELREFLAQSTAWILEVEAKIKHALLRVQSDALAHILRTAKRERTILKCKRQVIEDRLLQNRSAHKIDSYKTLARAARKCKTSFKKQVRKAFASVKEVTLQFDRASQVAVKLQTQNRKARRLATNLTVIESGLVVHQKDFKIPDSFIKEVYYADSQRLYFLSYSPSEEDKVCSASMQSSLGNGMKSVSPMLNMDENLLNLELCYLENIGPVVLLLDGENWESKLAHLRVIDDSTSNFFDGELEISVPEAWSMQLIPCLNCRLIVFFRSSATVMEVQVSRSRLNLNAFDFTCIRVQRLSSGAKAVDLAYNQENDHALVTYDNRCAIIKFSSNVLYKFVVYHNSKVLASAVNRHLVFFIYLISNNCQQLHMFDVYGTELGHIKCDLGNLVSPWFILYENQRNFLLSVGDEIWVLRRDNVSRTVGYVRLASCGRKLRRGTGELKFTTDIAPERPALDDMQPTKSRLSVKFEYTQSFTVGVPFPGRQKLSTDELLNFTLTQDDSAIYLYDYFNQAIRRYSKVFGSSPEAYTLSDVHTDYQLERTRDCKSYVIGMCILDDRTLVLVYNDSVLVHVDSTSMHQLHAVRFSEHKSTLCFTYAVTAYRIAVAFYSEKLVLELRRTAHSGSTDWCVFKSHLLPVGWHVRYLHFDSQSRRYALTVGDEGQSKVLVMVLDEQFSQSVCVSTSTRWKRNKRAFLCDKLCFVENEEGFDFYQVEMKVAYLGTIDLFTCCLLTITVARESQDSAVCTFMHYETSNLTRDLQFLGLHRTTYRISIGQAPNRVERKPRMQTVREASPLSVRGREEQTSADHRKRPLDSRAKERCKVT